MANSDAEALRTLIHAFIRRFGLLDQSRTPCGMPLATSDAHALMELQRAPGIEQVELASRLGLSKSAVSRMLARLEERGLVRRERCREDARAHDLHLSAQGERLATRVNETSLVRFGVLLSRLPVGTSAPLLECLAHLVNAVPEPGKLDMQAGAPE